MILINATPLKVKDENNDLPWFGFKIQPSTHNYLYCEFQFLVLDFIGTKHMNLTHILLISPKCKMKYLDTLYERL